MSDKEKEIKVSIEETKNEETQAEKVDREDTVVISRSDLNTILERLSKLESGDKRIRVKRPDFYTARAWFVDEEKKKLVVGYGKNRRTKREDGSEFLEVELFYDDEGTIKSKWVGLTDFRTGNNSIDVKIIEAKRIPIEREYGYTFIKNVDYDNYRTVESNVEVPIKVISEDVVYTIELPDKRRYDVNANALN